MKKGIKEREEEAWEKYFQVMVDKEAEILIKTKEINNKYAERLRLAYNKYDRLFRKRSEEENQGTIFFSD